ncbi:MAG TPA: flagellar hook-basal body complex protein FliE [Geminicoccus sp.]|jgi:flagellar hook-basal body complex protein FliE|uniref:flagellar hook-basal body complex protein FliE n=1 Tax=Geminicoccus sp. TaxID=2024832 RepID=UPI002E347BC1|nr:flagellar hook-basal body complex protein FliE [Geminicoccus sp.]HEX2529526.1 flagellar hook-basal body complex protein FliE [Geminicoccus sp.]
MAVEIGPKAATAAYRKALERISGGGSDAATAMPSFGELVKSQLQDAVQAGRLAEQTSADAMVGKADLQQVVEAVTAAELGLSTVTAVRDRVVAAYQEIMRMPI